MSPAVAKRRPVSERVQGVDSSLSGLTLRSGTPFRIEVGGGIQPTPTLKRTISGASSIKLNVHDPENRLLDSALLVEKFEAQLDGLWFRYKGADYNPPVTSFTLEERGVALLRELKGPVRAYARRGQKDELTRAEFIIGLVRQVWPRIPWHCPQLHDKQPIEKKSQGRAAKKEAKANRGAGIGDSKGLKVKGEEADRAQREIVDRALRVAEHDHAPFRVQVALVAGLIAESECRNLPGGHGTSKGVLQVIDTTAAAGGFDPMDVEASVHGFLTGYANGEGGAIAHFRQNPSAEPADIATAVQRNRDGASSYAPWVAEAREWVEAFTGGELGGSETVTEPRVFEVKKSESYWDAITRLAKDVNWRAFFVAGRFFLIDELELARGMVRLAIERKPGERRPHTPGIVNVKFKYNGDGPVTDVTVEAYAKQWNVPPGAVVTLAGYGPASLGFGDAPMKTDGKRKVAISSNRKAKTGEGRARYIVESIEGPLRDDKADARLVTVKLKKPTAPLPEPAAETKTVSRDGGSGGAESLDGVTIASTRPGSPAWGGTRALFDQFFTPFLEEQGLKPGPSKEQRSSNPGSDHDVDNVLAYAVDYPTMSGEQSARALAREIGWTDWRPNTFASKVIEVDGQRIEIQILWGAEIDHSDHVHVGAHRV